MRKDVRLGLAVGGILFGVVLVYVLFFAGGKGEDQYAVGGDTSSESTEHSTSAGGSNAGSSSSGGSARPYETGTTIVETGPIANTVTPQAPVGGNTGNAGARNNTVAQGNVPPVNGGVNPTTRPVGQVASGFGTPTANAGTSFNWRQLMEEGDLSGQLLSRTVTPTPGGGREEHRIIMDPPLSNGTAVEPRTGDSAAATGPRVYTVKSGDSFWSIAKEEYGNSSYYAHLVRANPKVDPAKLKAGMRITIPARDEVIPKNAPATALVPTPVAIDETRQYRVKKGDSLSSIAQRLYGRAAMADKIYQLNQDVIGPNPSALKLNAILTLPETPTRVAAN